MATRPILNPSQWSGLFQKLGIPQPMQYQLNDTVQPIAIVDSEISLTATVTPVLWGTPASAGELLAPVAATRLADTGQLAAGTWNFMAWLSVADNAASMNVRLRRRNAADAADIWSFRIGHGLNGTFAQPAIFRTTMAANERVVLEVVANGAAGSVYQGEIFAVQG